MQTILILISAGITILSLSLLLVSLFSYKKFRNLKLMFISIVFLLFFIRGLYLSYQVLSDQITNATTAAFVWVVDLLILILLYVTSLKR